MSIEPQITEEDRSQIDLFKRDCNSLACHIVREIQLFDVFVKARNATFDLEDKQKLGNDEVILYHCFEICLYRSSSLLFGIAKSLGLIEKYGFNVAHLNIGILFRALLLDSMHIHALCKLPKEKVTELSRSMIAFPFSKRQKMNSIGVCNYEQNNDMSYKQLCRIVNDITKAKKENKVNTTDTRLIDMFKACKIIIPHNLYSIQRLYLRYSSFDHYSLIPFYEEHTHMENILHMNNSLTLIKEAIGLISDFRTSNSHKS